MATADETATARRRFLQPTPLYLARLRLDGLTIDAEQEFRLVLLLSRLESSGAMPKTAATLARLIVPVLAGTPSSRHVATSIFGRVLRAPARACIGERTERGGGEESLAPSASFALASCGRQRRS